MAVAVSTRHIAEADRNAAAATSRLSPDDPHREIDDFKPSSLINVAEEADVMISRFEAAFGEWLPGHRGGTDRGPRVPRHGR